MQLKKEKQVRGAINNIPAGVKVRDEDMITGEALITTIRRAVSFYSLIQAHDGHWPAESAGPLFFVQPLVSPHDDPWIWMSSSKFFY
jgi:cycloartenol synthase